MADVDVSAFGAWVEILTISLGSGGAGTALVIALQKFLERHKTKSVEFGPNGQIKSMSGCSRKDVEHAVITVNQQ